MSVMGINKVLEFSINWDSYPSLKSFAKNKEKALLILYIAKKAANIQNLTAQEISSIIQNKFRIKITHQAIRGALNPVIGEHVDTIPRKDGIAYLLLPGGERALGLPNIKENNNFTTDQIIIPPEIFE